MDYGRGVVIRSFLWKLLERFSVQGLSLLITLVLARILDPKDYGIVALITVFTSLSSVIVDGGLNMALIQKKDADQTDFSTIFFSSIFISILLYALLFLSAPLIASFYDNTSLTVVIRAFSVIIIFEAANAVQRAYVAKNMLFKKLFLSSIWALIISGGIGLYLAINGYGVWALVCQQVCSNIITTVVMFYTIKWFPSFTFSIIRFKKLFNFGWKIFGINMMVSFYQNVRSLIIGKYYSPAALAFFERGYSLSQMIVSNISSSMQTVIFPVLSDKQDDENRVKSLVRKSIRLSSYVIFPALIALCVVAHPLIELILTEKWLPAVPYIWIFSIAYMIFIVQVSSMEAVKALGHSGFSLKFEIVKHIIETIILIITVFIGVYAIAIGTIIYNLISFILNIYPNIRYLRYGIKEQLEDILSSFFLSLLAGASVFWIQWLDIPNIIIIALQLLIGATIYIGVSYLVKMGSFMYIKSMMFDRTKQRKTK